MERTWYTWWSRCCFLFVCLFVCLFIYLFVCFFFSTHLCRSRFSLRTWMPRVCVMRTCQKPRDSGFVRTGFKAWKRRKNMVVDGGFNFIFLKLSCLNNSQALPGLMEVVCMATAALFESQTLGITEACAFPKCLGVVVEQVIFGVTSYCKCAARATVRGYRSHNRLKKLPSSVLVVNHPDKERVCKQVPVILKCCDLFLSVAPVYPVIWRLLDSLFTCTIPLEVRYSYLFF